MTSAGDWRGRVGSVWAAEWCRTDRSLADLANRLDTAIVDAAPRRGRVLDVGSGAGATSLALASARPDLTIIGVDLSPQLVAVAEARAVDRPGGGDIRFYCDDALAIADREGPFDLIVSRHGMMFFADPVAALARLRAAAVPGAALVFSCFADRADNGFATIADAVTGIAPPDSTAFAPGPFAFSDREQVASWLDQAGWRTGSATRTAFGYMVGAGPGPVADAVSFLSRIGPAARTIADATPTEQAGLLDRLAAALERYRVDDRLILPASAWIWRAQA